jgi:hypothetical protein
VEDEADGGEVVERPESEECESAKPPEDCDDAMQSRPDEWLGLLPQSEREEHGTHTDDAEPFGDEDFPLPRVVRERTADELLRWCCKKFEDQTGDRDRTENKTFSEDGALARIGCRQVVEQWCELAFTADGLQSGLSGWLDQSGVAGYRGRLQFRFCLRFRKGVFGRRLGEVRERLSKA